MTANVVQLGRAGQPCQECKVVIPYWESCYIVTGGVVCIACGDRRGLGDIPEQP